MSGKFQGYLYLSLAMILVGSTVIASKIIATGLPPFTATALRFAVAFPLFLLLMWLTRTSWPKLKGRDWLLLIAQAGAGSVGYTSTHSPLGIALIFGAVICEGLFILLNKRVKTEISPLALSTLMAGLGFAVAIIPALFETHATAEIDRGAIVAVLYYALIPTVAGFLLWYAGSAKVSGTEASVFTALAPVSAVAFAFLLLDEPVGAPQLLGIGCVLAAVLGLTLPQILAGRRTARAFPVAEV